MELTKFLNLLKKDPVADAADTFNIKAMLNDNWDKLDAFAEKLSEDMENTENDLSNAKVQLGDEISMRAMVQFGSYNGSDTYGSSNPITLFFDFNPKLVIVSDATYYDHDTIILVQGSSALGVSGTSSDFTLKTTWRPYEVEWYSDKSAINQLNNASATYCYVAIG